jgi:2-oxoglutarate ferredoxin oxidoreductase subunit delta
MTVAIGGVVHQTRRRDAPFQPLDIATDRCKGCELCVGICPKRCLSLDTRVVNGLGYHPVRLTDAAGCTSCALCARICPDAVFAVYARPKDR